MDTHDTYTHDYYQREFTRLLAILDARTQRKLRTAEIIPFPSEKMTARTEVAPQHAPRRQLTEPDREAKRLGSSIDDEAREDDGADVGARDQPDDECSNHGAPRPPLRRDGGAASPSLGPRRRFPREVKAEVRPVSLFCGLSGQLVAPATQL